ncbi:MAG: serine hydrolase domain-containing protein, partial [Roseitalea porphyridii]
MTIFSSFAVAALLTAQASEPRFDADPPDIVVPRLETAFDALEADGFSGFVAVTHNGEIVFESGYGAANPETGAAFTRDTRIDMGSVVKTHTGLMAAQLIEDGVLDPDMTLGQYFEDVPADMADITLHQLLTHSAGFPGGVASDHEEIDRDELLRRAFNTPLRYEPGTGYQYSNTGFSLVAAIIETVTGRSYEEVLLDDFLLPAGITRTGYTRSYDMDNPPVDMAYTVDGQSLHALAWGGHAPGWALIGNGGMFTTVGEMIAWREAVNAGEVVSAAALGRT